MSGFDFRQAQPADIMSDVWPQMTLTFHLGCACQVRLIGDE
jgi:hypothetical protein